MVLGREIFFRLRAPADLLGLPKRWVRRPAECGKGRRQRPCHRKDRKGIGRRSARNAATNTRRSFRRSRPWTVDPTLPWGSRKASAGPAPDSMAASVSSDRRAQDSDKQLDLSASSKLSLQACMHAFAPGSEHYSHLFIPSSPPLVSCVVGSGKRSRCVIQRMSISRVFSEEGFLACEFAVLPQSRRRRLSLRPRDCRRTTHPWGFGCPYPQRASVLKL
jgi:hypothetical protein